MKEQENKELEFFVKTAMKDLELDKVSSNFNDRLIDTLRQSEKIKIRPQPLISKTTWWVLAILFSVLMYLGSFILDVNQDFWLLSLKYNTIGTMDWLDFSMDGFKLTTTTYYALLGLIVFTFFQVLILRQYFSKRRVIL